MNCNPVPRRTGIHPHEVLLGRSGLTSVDSGLQLDMGGSR